MLGGHKQAAIEFPARSFTRSLTCSHKERREAGNELTGEKTTRLSQQEQLGSTAKCTVMLV